MFLAKILIGMMVLQLSSGCASMGREFPAGQVSMIRIGETTRKEIRTIFGAPWRTGIENGQRTWTYGNYHYSLFGQGSTEDLVIWFDEGGVVSAYQFNTTKHKEGAAVSNQR